MSNPKRRFFEVKTGDDLESKELSNFITNRIDDEPKPVVIIDSKILVVNLHNFKRVSGKGGAKGYKDFLSADSWDNVHDIAFMNRYSVYIKYGGGFLRVFADNIVYPATTKYLDPYLD